MKTIDGKDVSVWSLSSGYYVQLSISRGEVRLIFGYTDAMELADRLTDDEVAEVKTIHDEDILAMPEDNRYRIQVSNGEPFAILDTNTRIALAKQLAFASDCAEMLFQRTFVRDVGPELAAADPLPRRRASDRLSDDERSLFARVLGLLDPLPVEAICEVGIKTALHGPSDMWNGLEPDVQVGLIMEWFVARAAATYGTEAAIEQLTKEIELLRKREAT